MTETLVGVSPPSSKDPADPPSAEELAAARELVRQARAQEVALTGSGGSLKALTKTVLEIALEEEMAEHLGCDSVIRWVGTGVTPATGNAPKRC
jgi:hypothetical protein